VFNFIVASKEIPILSFPEFIDEFQGNPEIAIELLWQFR
jgi:hypothetical protein